MLNGRDVREANTERFGENMSTPAPDPAPTPPAPSAPEPTPPADPAPTPDPLGDAGLKALQAERTRAAKAEADLKALQKQIEDSQKTAEQKAADAITAATTVATEATAKALRYEVAADKGIDLALASRLTGSTREELEADADKLMTLIPKGQAPATPPTGPTVPGQQPGGAQTPPLVTQSDLDALAAAGKYDQINTLRREGRLSHLGVAPPAKR